MWPMVSLRSRQHSLDINGCMEDIIAALGGSERKLVGVIINELQLGARVPQPAIGARSAICLSKPRKPDRAGSPPPHVPRITLGGLRIAVLNLEQTADFMIDLVFPQRRIGPAAVFDLRQRRGAARAAPPNP